MVRQCWAFSCRRPPGVVCCRHDLTSQTVLMQIGITLIGAAAVTSLK